MMAKPWNAATILTEAMVKREEAVTDVRASHTVAPTEKRGRGRPTRRSHDLDIKIADAVYRAVFSGMAYREEALRQGQGVALRHGEKLSVDGVEAVIEKLISVFPDSCYSTPPGESYRAMVQVLGQFLPERKLPNGKKTLSYKPPGLGRINSDDPGPAKTAFPKIRNGIPEK